LGFFNRKAKEQLESHQHMGAVAFMPGGLFDMAVATVFINILGLALPLAMLQIFDKVIPEKDSATLFWMVIGFGSAIILESLLRVGRSYIGGWMGARFEHLMSCKALERLTGANITDFDKRGTGAYLERLNALAGIRDFYAGPFAGALLDIPFAVLFLGVMYYIAGTLVLVPIVLIFLFSAAVLTLGRLGRAMKERMLADDRRFGFIIDILGGIHTVKGLGMEEQMLRRYERLQEGSANADFSVTRQKGSALTLGAILSGLAVFGVSGFGALQVIDGTLTVGGLLASIVLAGLAVHPLENVVGLWAQFQDAKLSQERLGEIFDLPIEKPTGLIDLPTIQGAIDFQGLTFSFGKGKDGEDLAPVFKNLNLSIEAGQTIGVVGSSASGKTTLLFLMQGLLTPTAGTARVDGYDIRECDPASIRRHVAYLPQEGVVFKGTLLENLTMFRDEQANEALDIAKLLGMDNIVANLPLGYDTPIGEGAEDKLPRGTRQRIAIARALVDKPRILLFDEANSFIDGAGDAMLRDLLVRLKGRVTLIMVTQRPSMLRLADRIVEIRGDDLFEHDLHKGQQGQDQGQDQGQETS